MLDASKNRSSNGEDVVDVGLVVPEGGARLEEVAAPVDERDAAHACGRDPARRHLRDRLSPLEHYESIQEMRDHLNAMAAAYVECQIDDEILWGVDIDASITTATLKAIISAVNRRVR